MKRCILLYGFDTLPEIMAVSQVVVPFGAEIVPVGRNGWGKSLGVLAGMDREEEASPIPAGGAGMGRMLVFCGLDKELDKLLAALRQADLGQNCLKAVLTSHNRGWNGITLYGELLREHRELQRRGKS